MKKKICVLLTLALLLGTLTTSLLVPTSADTVSQPHPDSIEYDFNDWETHAMLATDKYTSLAVGIIGINGNPALNVVPLKQGTSFNWNHFGIPCVFANGKEYVISYDVTLISNLTLDTPRAQAKWHAAVTQSNTIGTGQDNPYVSDISNANFTVVSGAWTHVQGSFTVGSSEWRTLDTLYFWEEQLDSNIENSQIAIDNLVVMEKNDFQKLYPNGVTARTDVPAVNMLANNFNDNRAIPLWCNNQTLGNFTAALDNNGRAKWTWEQGATAFNFFNFEAGKTYHLSFDAAIDGSTDANLIAVATEGRTDLTNANAETFTGSSLKIKANEWTHFDLTLNATKAHKFFAMALDASAKTIVWMDNFALYVDGATPAYDLTPRSDKYTSSYKVISNFSDERSLIQSCNWYWATAEKVITMSDGNKVQEVIHYGAWSKAAGHMTFLKSKSYVVNFDIYGVSETATKGDVINSGLRFYAHKYQLAGDPAGQQFAYSDGKGGLIGDLSIKAGEWTHYTLEATMPSDASGFNYFALFNCTSNPVTYYIDNLTIVEKTDCTAGHTDGVWVDDVIASCKVEGHHTMNCAVCGTKINEGTLPKTHIPSEKTTLTAPKCNKEGSYEIRCTKCKEVLETGSIAKTSHTPGEWEETVVADCHHAGEKICKCTVCQETISTQVVPQLSHIASKWITDIEPAAGVNGHKHKQCTLCGDVLDEEELESLEPLATEAPTNEAEKKESEGCRGSLIGGNIFVVTTFLTGAWMVIKKKKDN